MRSKTLAFVMLVMLLAIVPMIPMASAQNGARIDVIRYLVVMSPDAQLLAMLEGDGDYLPDLIRTADIETLDANGFTITADLGFHMGYIGWNIRDTATIRGESQWAIDHDYEYRTDINYWPLHDIEFRHALIHGYDQLGIIPPIYGYTVTPVRSLIPPAISAWYNPNTPEHPYNLGDPFAITEYPSDHSTCGILREAGYVFVDGGTIGSVDDADYWEMPNSDPLPHLVMHTPLLETAPTSFQHGQEFVSDLGVVGLAATSANGDAGLESQGTDFDYYTKQLVDYGLFDGYMLFHQLGRFPDHVFDFCHSSQDVLILAAQDNAVGCNDAALDAYIEEVKFGLDHTAKKNAATELQNMLYNPELPNADNFALSRMLLYSRTLFNGFEPDLHGIIKSPGYGSDNGWTELFLHWDANPRLEDVDGDSVDETVVVYLNGEDPDSLNPTYAQTVYEWNYLDPNYDGMTTVNPYNHKDMPWVATDWTVEETPGDKMNVSFTIRDDVYWADGYQYTASDAEFSLEFLRDYNVGIFSSTTQFVEDVDVIDATHFTVMSTDTSQWLLYDFGGLSALLPPQIWDRAWASDADVIGYNCWEITYGTDMGDGSITGHGTYSPGPWADEVATNVFGTGPFILQPYDAVGRSGDVWKNPNYWLTEEELTALEVEMFHEVGDVDRNGLVNVLDLTLISFSFGYFMGEPEYNPNADLNQDEVVDTRDLATAAFYLGWQREYP